MSGSQQKPRVFEDGFLTSSPLFETINWIPGGCHLLPVALCCIAKPGSESLPALSNVRWESWEANVGYPEQCPTTVFVDSDECHS